MNRIEVQLNGERREIDDGLTVAGLLGGLGVPEAVAIVEINGEVVPKSRYNEEPVAAGDFIEIVRFMGGG